MLAAAAGRLVRPALAAALAAWREDWAEHMAVQHLTKRWLSRGWQAWLEIWLARREEKRKLAAAAGRLMKPALSAALTHWRVDWQVKPQQAAP